MTQRNIRLLIAYDGSDYSGWQRQKNSPTIQGTLEDRLSVMTNSDITLHGAGRTDAGVHANGMVANFMTESPIPCTGYLKGLNSMLPRAIRILKVDGVSPEFHSRYSATGKTYKYSIFTGLIQQPIGRLYTAHYPGNFDIRTVSEALRNLNGTHDFSCFEAAGSRDISRPGRGAVRTLYETKLIPHKLNKNAWTLIFTGDGFLRHMIRNIIGTLMEVGTGKLTLKDFNAVLESQSREQAGPTAPACGLILEKVHYTPLTL